MALRAIEYENGTLVVLDQLLLPKESKYIPISGRRGRLEGHQQNAGMRYSDYCYCRMLEFGRGNIERRIRKEKSTAPRSRGKTELFNIS